MVNGHKAEDAFGQSMVMYGGSLGAFWSNCYAGLLMTLGILLLLWPLVALLERRRATPIATEPIRE